MKFAFISPFPPLRGGISKETETIYNYLIKNNHEVKVINFKRLYPSFLFPGKNQYIKENNYQNDQNIITLLDSINPLTWNKVSNYILKNKINKIIFRYWHPFFIIPYIFIINKIRKKNNKIKIFCICDNVYPHKYFPLSKLLIKWFLKKIDKFFVMSDNTFEQIKTYVNVKDIKKIFLPLKENFGPALEKYDSQKKLKIETDFSVLFFGLIRDYKGLDVLLKSLVEFKKNKKDFKLIIAGECYENKEKYLNFINQNDLQKNILWNESQDTDFLKYELYKGGDTTNTSLLETFSNKSTTSYSLNDFDPHSHNYFRIIVYDTLNQSTKGNFLSNLIQPIPEAVSLDPIDSFGNELTIVWSVYPTSDFQRYNLYQAYDISMNDKEILFTTSSRTENSYFSADNDYETTYYFQVSIIDDWGYEVFSNIESIDPEYVTFIHNYDAGSDIDIGYHGVQTASGKYKMIGKTSSDVIMNGTNRSGTDPWLHEYSYLNESPVDLIEIEED